MGRITIPTAAGMLAELCNDYDAQRGLGKDMSASTLKELHLALNTMYTSQRINEQDPNALCNLMKNIYYDTAYKNLAFRIKRANPRQERVESQECEVTLTAFTESVAYLRQLPDLSAAFMRAVLTCMWAGLTRSDDISQLRLQDLCMPYLLNSVGPLPCHYLGFAMASGTGGVRHSTFTRAPECTACPVNAIGSFLWYKYCNAPWDLPLPDSKHNPGAPSWSAEAFFCVDKATRMEGASMETVAALWKSLTAQSGCGSINDMIELAFCKGAAFKLSLPWADPASTRTVGKWRPDGRLTCRNLPTPAPFLLPQCGWPVIDNNPQQGYFNERFLIQVPQPTLPGLYPFLAGLQAAAGKAGKAGKVPYSGHCVAAAIPLFGEAVIQDFVHQAALDALAGWLQERLNSQLTPLERHVWGLPHVQQLVVQQCNNLNSKAFESQRPRSVKELLGELSATVHWWKAAVAHSSQIMQASLAAVLAHPAQPHLAQPLAMQTSLAAALAPPAQPLAMQASPAATLSAPTHPHTQLGLPFPAAAKPMKGGHGDWLKTVSGFENMKYVWEVGWPGVRPPLMVLEAQSGRPHRCNDKNYSCQLESFKDCVFTLKVVEEVEGLTARDLQARADEDFKAAAAQAQGPNKTRLHRRWSGHRKWLQHTYPQHFLAGREMKKQPSMTAAEAMAVMDRPVENVPSPLRLLKRGREEQGIHSPSAQSLHKVLHLDEPDQGPDPPLFHPPPTPSHHP